MSCYVLELRPDPGPAQQTLLLLIVVELLSSSMWTPGSIVSCVGEWERGTKRSVKWVAAPSTITAVTSWTHCCFLLKYGVPRSTAGECNLVSTRRLSAVVSQCTESWIDTTKYTNICTHLAWKKARPLHLLKWYCGDISMRLLPLEYICYIIWTCNVNQATCEIHEIHFESCFHFSHLSICSC